MDLTVFLGQLSKLEERVKPFQHGPFDCLQCGKTYRYKESLYTHQKYECGKEPQFQCPHCPYKAKQKGSLKSHIIVRHLNNLALQPDPMKRTGPDLGI